MTRDLIDRLIRPASPVPDPKMLATEPVSNLHEQMRNEMQEQQNDRDHVEEETSRTKGRGLLIGIAAVVAVVIGVFALYQTTQTTEVAAERTPVEIATEYLDEYRNFDVDRVESMLAEDATVLPWESFASRRDWQRDLRFLEASGFQIIGGECGEVPSGGVLVRCEYEAHGLGSAQIGLEPFGGHQFQLTIEDGLVTRSDMGFNFYSGFSETMWWPFQAWIEENHPEDFDVLYEDPELSRQTDDAIALWEQRVQDYVAFKSEAPTTTSSADATPPELAGTWRSLSDDPNAESICLGMGPTSHSLSICGLGAADGAGGTHSVAGDTITMVSSMQSCPGGIGLYRWEVDDDTLTFTQLDPPDVCPARRDFLDGQTFTR